MRAATRLLSMALRQMALLSETAEERLAYALTQLACEQATILPSGLGIDIKNEDLASLVDISFVTASS